MNNLIRVGFLFNPHNPDTVEVTMSAIRDGALKAACIYNLKPSVAKALVKRHKRIVVESA